MSISLSPCTRTLRDAHPLSSLLDLFFFPRPLDSRVQEEANARNRIILLGLIVSYLPQHYRIVSRRTSEGISPLFVLLGTTSATSGFAAILTVEPSRQDIACCKQVETFECLAGLLGIAQLGVQWICFSLM